MTSSRPSPQEKPEAYARALLEAARKGGRANLDWVQWMHAQKFSPEVLETLATMHEAGDLDLIRDVARTYKQILDTDDKTVTVTVTTAVPMDDELRQKVIEKEEAELGAPIYLVERVDPSIIGGIVLEALGNRCDASVRAQLINIRKRLASTYIGSDE